MEVLHPHCAGLDVHKETVVACVRHMDRQVKTVVKTFPSTTRGSAGIRDRTPECVKTRMNSGDLRFQAL
jgi:hypothetical protein